MAERSRTRRRLRWLVLAGLVGAGAWVARSRRVSAATLIEQWPPAASRPAAASSTGGPAPSSGTAAESVSSLNGAAETTASVPQPELTPEPEPLAEPGSLAEPEPLAGTESLFVEPEPLAEPELPAEPEPVAGSEPELLSGPEPPREPEPVTAEPVQRDVDAWSAPSVPQDGSASAPIRTAPAPTPRPSTLAGQALFTPTGPNEVVSGSNQVVSGSNEVVSETAEPDGAEPSAARPSPSPRPRPGAEPLRDQGRGSAEPLPDGSAPGPEYTIKGNADSMLFHRPSSPDYSRTKAEVWFRTATDARAAGFTEWSPTKRTDG